MQQHGLGPQNAAVHQALMKKPQELTYVEKKMLKNEKLSALWLVISKLALEQDY